MLLQTGQLYTCCLRNTFKHLYECTSSSPKGNSIQLQVKASPKLMLYGKYGTQRVVLRQNIAYSQHLALPCAIFVSCLPFYLPYFSYSTCSNALTYTYSYTYIYSWFLLHKRWLLGSYVASYMSINSNVMQYLNLKQVASQLATVQVRLNCYIACKCLLYSQLVA